MMECMTHPDILNRECNGIPEAEPKYHCADCGDGIYEGDWFYRVLGCVQCEDCHNNEYRETA